MPALDYEFLNAPLPPAHAPRMPPWIRRPAASPRALQAEALDVSARANRAQVESDRAWAASITRELQKMRRLIDGIEYWAQVVVTTDDDREREAALNHIDDLIG